MKIGPILVGISLVVLVIRILTSKEKGESKDFIIALVGRFLIFGLIFLVLWLIESITGQ